MKWLLVLSVIVLCATSASSDASMNSESLDTTIRILIVKDGGASQSQINEEIDFLMSAWTNPTGVGSGSPITLTIVNPSQAVIIPMISSDAAILYGEISTYAETIVPTFTKNARELFAADVIIAFTDNDLVTNLFDDACGATFNGTWLGSSASFIPNAEQIDTRGAANWYIGLVEDACSAGMGTMAHELGHLLGAQHTFGGNAPLLPDGRGDFWTKVTRVGNGLAPDTTDG